MNLPSSVCVQSKKKKKRKSHPSLSPPPLSPSFLPVFGRRRPLPVSLCPRHLSFSIADRFRRFHGGVSRFRVQSVAVGFLLSLPLALSLPAALPRSCSPVRLTLSHARNHSLTLGLSLSRCLSLSRSPALSISRSTHDLPCPEPCRKLSDSRSLADSRCLLLSRALGSRSRSEFSSWQRLLTRLTRSVPPK